MLEFYFWPNYLFNDINVFIPMQNPYPWYFCVSTHFIHTQSNEPDSCIYFWTRRCVCVFVRVEKDESVPMRRHWVSYWDSKNSPLSLLVTPHFLHFPVHPFTTAPFQPWFTFLLLNHVWVSMGALFPLSLMYFSSPVFSVWWFSAKRDHQTFSDLHP